MSRSAWPREESLIWHGGHVTYDSLEVRHEEGQSVRRHQRRKFKLSFHLIIAARRDLLTISHGVDRENRFEVTLLVPRRCSLTTERDKTYRA